MYGQLLGERRFDVPFTGRAPIKDYRTHRVVGTNVPRPICRRKRPASTPTYSTCACPVSSTGASYGLAVRGPTSTARRSSASTTCRFATFPARGLFDAVTSSASSRQTNGPRSRRPSSCGSSGTCRRSCPPRPRPCTTRCGEQERSIASRCTGGLHVGLRTRGARRVRPLRFALPASWSDVAEPGDCGCEGRLSRDLDVPAECLPLSRSRRGGAWPAALADHRSVIRILAIVWARHS